MKKQDRQRPYRPALVSSETLAYLLDCSPSMINAYVRKGHLPKPIPIGNLVRWNWVDVEKFLGINPPQEEDDAPDETRASYDDRTERYGERKKER